MIENSSKLKILFVCMGNICRSPLAQGIFKVLLSKYNLEPYFELDSAGTTDYHVGELPDYRAVKVALNNFTIDLSHRARQFQASDFEYFDYILVMDHLNYDAVIQMSKQQAYDNKVYLFRSFDNSCVENFDVPDPYYGTEDDFVEVAEIVNRAGEGFIQFLNHQGKLALAQ
ncbi:MAG: hypothetical protein RLZZ293_98 [Pseudomonadota bacterium]|jgi:protein-tyrosine phosphatase